MSFNDNELPVGGTPRPGTMRPRHVEEDPSPTPVREEERPDQPALFDREQTADQPVEPAPAEEPPVQRPTDRQEPRRPRRQISTPHIPMKLNRQYAVLGIKLFVLVILIVLAATKLNGFLMVSSLIVLTVLLPFAVKPDILDTVLPVKFRPEGPVPHRGARGLLWLVLGKWLYSRFGWSWLTSLSQRERLRNALSDLWTLRKTQKIVALVNSKGGSAKTAVTVWLSVFMAFAIKRHIVALDANENTGHTAKRLGILRRTEADEAGKPDEGSIELRTWMKACESGDLDTLEKLTEVVDWHPETGVSVISSEAASNEPFSQETFQKALRTLKRIAHYVFCDLGNGIKHPANLGSVHEAHTLVFTGNAAMADSLDDITNTMTRFSELGYAEKVSNGIIVIVSARARDRKKYAERYNHPIDRVFVIPFNRYMKQGKVVRRNKVPLRIRVILYEILVAIVKSAVVETPDRTDSVLGSAPEQPVWQ